MNAQPVAKNVSAAESRRFGLLVGAVFVAIALISRWRGRSEEVVWTLGAIGAVLVVAGALVPVALGPVYRGWMALARGLSRVTTPIFMGVVYFVVMTPMGLVRRLVGSNPLVVKETADGFWVAAKGSHDLERQF